MLKVFTASTTEIDNPEAATAEILERLDLDNLAANSVGIVACYYEFLETGILDALRERLPFDLIGCTVLGSATVDGYSMEQLSLTVLSSDDIRFAVALSPEITKNNVREPIETAWRQARGQLPGDPALVFTFAPFMADVSGDFMVHCLDEICGGLPLFGTLSNDATNDFAESRTFINGEHAAGKMALLLAYGPINPRFYVASVSPKGIQQQKGIVTESNGYIVKKINNLLVLDYLTSIGVRRETLTALTTLPFMVDYGDGTDPVALGIYSILPEGALCGGKMPVGAGLTFAEIDYGSVMETAETALQKALDDMKKNGANALLAIPCMTRSLMISPNVEDEMQKTAEILNGKLPYMLFYSGGEICPMHKAGALVNRFHNYTYTLIVL